LVTSKKIRTDKTSPKRQQPAGCAFEKLSDSKPESEITNRENGNLTLENHAVKQAQVPASGRRPYGSSGGAI